METGDSFSTFVIIILGLFYSTVFISSTVGNVWVIITCYKTVTRAQVPLMWLVANLATTDLLFTFLTILNVIGFLWRWVGGDATCKVQGFLIETSYTISIATLVLISYQRLHAITDPFEARVRNWSSKEILKLVVTWVACLTFCSPLLHLYRVETEPSGETVCAPKTWGNIARQLFYGLHAIIFFVLPLSYMIFTQRKIFRTLQAAVQPARTSFSATRHKKVARTLTAITVAFGLCWSPFMVTRTLLFFHLLEPGLVWRASQLLICLNATLDPLLYGYYGGNLKSVLRQFRTCCKRGRLRTSVFTVTKVDTANQSTRHCPRRQVLSER